jgi:hypothetical protein
VLPAGTALTFVSDAAVDPKTARAGRVFKVHLLAELTLDGTTIAAAGTLAQLVVLDRVTETGGKPAVVVAIGGFNVRGGGLPVTPVNPTLATIEVGTNIATRTMGSVEQIGTRTIIRVPLPFTLPADAPNGAFTPIPARTNTPGVVRPRAPRRPTPSPKPTPEPSPSELPSEAPSP